MTLALCPALIWTAYHDEGLMPMILEQAIGRSDDSCSVVRKPVKIMSEKNDEMNEKMTKKTNFNLRNQVTIVETVIV